MPLGVRVNLVLIDDHFVKVDDRLLILASLNPGAINPEFGPLIRTVV